MIGFPTKLSVLILCGGFVGAQAANFTASEYQSKMYRGKILAIGCSDVKGLCTIKMERTNNINSQCTSDEFSWYGKTAGGAVMTGMLNKAFLAGQTIDVSFQEGTCFEGDMSKPRAAYFNIIGTGF